MTSSSVDVAQLHKRYILTPWSVQATLDMPSIERAEGSYLYDAAGKRYLDLSAGLVAVNLGHGHPRVVEAIARQAATLTYASPQFFNSTRAQLGEKLAAISPWSDGCRTFFTTCGGEANEDAVKMARAITGRQKVMTAYRSFHGSAPGAGTLTGENRRWPNEPGIPGVLRFFTPNPYRSPFHTDDPAVECARALEHLETVVTYENPAAIAALLIEPVVGTNGAIVYPDGYLRGVRELCTKYGILLIFDEVMCGFGRTGASFASVKFNVSPDMLTIAKAVTSAYVPLGGVLVHEPLAAYFDTHPLPSGHTFSGHPLAMAAALAAVDTYVEERLFDRALEIESWIRDGLAMVKSRCPMVGDARGIGAFWAIELVKDRATKEPIVPWQGPNPGPMPAMLKALRELGVYAFGRYNIVLVTPPLTIQRDELYAGFDALATVFERMP